LISSWTVITILLMTREEAIAICRAGEEATVKALLELSAAVEKLTKRVEKLEEALARKSTNSSNSSKPPSSDGITKPPGKRRAQEGETKRKTGGRKGHKGVTRQLIPENEVNRTEKLYPEKCKECGALFPETPPADMLEPEPRRHQQFDIPP
jgi:transposase